MKKWIIGFVVLFIVSVISLSNAELIFTPTDDACIQDGASHTGSWSVIIVVRDPYNTTEHSRKSYLRFDISSLSQPAASAEFSLAINNLGSTPGERVIVVWGLIDESLDNWSEDTITWDNAPGNDVSSTWEFDATKAVQLGTFTVSDDDYSAGDIVTFSSPALTNFVNSDTNGYITIMLSRQDTSGAWISCASKEHTSLPAPKLTIIPIPEPASIGLVLLGLGLLRRR